MRTMGAARVGLVVVIASACSASSEQRDDSLGADVLAVDGGGKADTAATTTVTSNVALDSVALKRLACRALADASAIASNATELEACKAGFAFRVRRQVRSNLYHTASNGSPITWKLEVDVRRESPSQLWRVDLSRAIDPEWKLTWKATYVPNAGPDDDFLRTLAAGLGESLDVDDPQWEEYLGPATLADLGADVRAGADAALANIRSRLPAGDSASYREHHYQVFRDEETIGYIVAIDLRVDHPLFDGAGYYLYLNMDGHVVVTVDWQG